VTSALFFFFFGFTRMSLLLLFDNLINQNHLFKRSIILIKAWCYYESRILGAHHGLISTYALETLVLYIFHVFNNSFAGPLEVTEIIWLYFILVFLMIDLTWYSFCLYRCCIDFWNSLVNLTGIISV